MKKLLIILTIVTLVFLGLVPYALADGESAIAVDDFTQIAAGRYHSIALRSDGTVWSWGDNRIAQVGNGGGSNALGDYGPVQSEPVMVMVNAVAVAAGDLFSLVLKEDGSLWGWGANYYGALANEGSGNKVVDQDEVGDDLYYQTRPVKIMDEVATMAAGTGFTLILQTDGRLWSCGLNNYGQLGNGGQANQELLEGTAPSQTEPLQILDNVAVIAAGESHALALKEDGSVWAWGRNQFGQVGLSMSDSDRDHPQTGPYQTLPVRVIDSGISMIVAGGANSYAIDSSNTLWGWGSNQQRQLLDDNTPYYDAPQIVYRDVRAVAAASDATIVLRLDNTLWGWGANGNKRIHYDMLADSVLTNPYQIMSGVAQVAMGEEHTMAIKQDGTLWVWGDNSFGQLALDPDARYAPPVQISFEYELPEMPEPEEQPPLPEPEPEIETEPEPEPLPEANPLPYIIGGVLGVALIALIIFLVVRHKRKAIVPEILDVVKEEAPPLETVVDAIEIEAMDILPTEEEPPTDAAPVEAEVSEPEKKDE